MRKFLFLIICLNVIRFIGLESSPPGFYIDEAGGAAQVICIKQSSYDFYLNKIPLFSPEFPDVGVYTPGYLYGEYLWTTIFGDSIYAFRSFLAFVTALTVLLLFLWCKRKSGIKLATFVAFFATITPWAFQFSRIAWDPPIAVLFLITGLWISGWEKRAWLAGIFFAFAAYSYGPLRLTAVLFLIFLPGFSIKNKIWAAILFGLTCIPLIWEMQHASFMARANNLLLWSASNENPYKDFNTIDLVLLFSKQIAEHFSLKFLFLSGDANLRHSIQQFGMLSWVSGLIFVSGVVYLVINRIVGADNFFSGSHTKKIIQVAIIGIVSGIIPSALTNEGNPHALRAISSWPFFMLLFGALATELDDRLKSRWFIPLIICVSLLEYGFYLRSYFFTYPKIASESFKTIDFPLITAYKKMVVDRLSCSQVVFSNYPKINVPITFSAKGDGREYLKTSWHQPESWGVWTKDEKSSLLLPIPIGKPTELVLIIRSPITELHLSNPIVIVINDKWIINADLNKPNGNEVHIQIPKSFDHNKYLEIKINVLKPVKPRDIGLGDDERNIGLGLEQAIFR